MPSNRLGDRDHLQALTVSAVSRTINAATANIEVQKAVPGKRFVVFYVLIKADAASTIDFNSGATEIGAAELAADEWVEMSGQGSPVLIGRAVNESFNIDNSGSITLRGTAVIGLVDSVVPELP